MEHLDVLIVGAGLSGVGAACTLQTQSPWASFAIFEARDAIGGTWDLFRYPGVRSDSDMFTLGYSQHPWAGDKSIADGASILRYIRETAVGSGIDQNIRFGHRIVSLGWQSEEARWHVVAQRTDSDQLVEVTANFVFACTGYYRYDRGYRPDFPGLEGFGGTIVHPQTWPADLDVTGKQVVVIGSGATAVTLVPALAPAARHVTMLQRSPSYIASLPARDPVVDRLRRLLPARYASPVIRWFKALTTQGFFQLSRRQPGYVKRFLRRQVIGRLPPGYDVDTHFTPRYEPWDERLCLVPDGDLFKAISDGTASVVTDHIESFTETGLRLRSGQELEADIIVTATGLELLFLGGIELTIDGEPVKLAGRLTYKGMMLDGVPNLAIAIGYANASWTLKCDLTCAYVSRLLNHMRASGLRQCTPVNRGTSSTSEPLIGLTSGYVQRSAHLLPSQGEAPPWRVHQSYLRDYRALKWGAIEDGVMSLSRPVRSDPVDTAVSVRAS